MKGLDVLWHYVVPFLMAIIVIYYYREAQKLNRDKAKIERQCSEMKLKALQQEAEFKQKVLRETQSVTEEIAQDISNQLIENPTWLDRFMDETGATYGASVYGKRIRHFFYEKRRLAKEAINSIEARMKENTKKYCLLIDSGTTMYPLFREMCERLRNRKTAVLWRDRIYIVTNNIPGVQYLMKNAKERPGNDYSEIVLRCLLMPGKPLSVYAANTGRETEGWLRGIRDFLRREWGGNDDEFEILGFITGNYISAHKDEKDGKILYYPVARGEGHLEIKKIMSQVSDKVFLIAPLMKFSFANVDTLNLVNDFQINRNDWNNARKYPTKVKYEEVEIDPHKCIFFTTNRFDGDEFAEFSRFLRADLNYSYHPDSIRIVADFKMRQWLPKYGENVLIRQLELEAEIPHENLRKRYEAGDDIWDKAWIKEFNEDDYLAKRRAEAGNAG